MLTEKPKHKHTTKVEYIPEVLDKLGKKRWIIIDKCTECNYERARDVTEKPPTERTKGE